MKNYVPFVAALLGVMSLSMRAQADPSPIPAFESMPHLLQTHPFDLNEVQILGGVWKTNQDLDARYLLSLDPDRLLHNFYVNAGLPSTAKPLGGWEDPGIGLRGHFVGHYLSACAQMYAATGNPAFKERGNYLVDGLAKCQNALGTGYLSAFPATDFDVLENKYGGVWAPYYTIHKIMAGLLDQYHYCANPQALAIACRMADYFKARMDKLAPDQIEKMLRTDKHAPQNEFGGMGEVVSNLYAVTRKPQYLALANLFDREWFVQPLVEGRDNLAHLHANTHTPQAIGLARRYELTGEERFRQATQYYWSQVMGAHSFVTGGSNDEGEHFMGPLVEAGALTPSTAETCNVYNMLKLTQHVFCWNPDVRVADYVERALYNHILTSIDPDSGMTTYFISQKPGHFKTYGTPDTTFWCCTGTGVENHATYGQFIYYHSEDSLWVNLFVPSRVTWREKQFSLAQDTQFPESDRTTLTVSTPTTTRLKVLLRVPSWATQGATIKINGQQQKVDTPSGHYVALDRTWKNGDKIELQIPLKLYLLPAKDDPRFVSVMYGPLVMAGELGREGMPLDDKSPQNNAFDAVADPAVPSLAGDSSQLSAWLKPVGNQPLAFETVNAGRPHDVRLVPFYQIHHQRYTLYWRFDNLRATPLN